MGAVGERLAVPGYTGEDDIFVEVVLGVVLAGGITPERCKMTRPPPAIAKHTKRAAIPTIRFDDFRASCDSALARGSVLEESRSPTGAAPPRGLPHLP